MNGSEEETSPLSPEGRADEADPVLNLLTREGWCTNREIEDHLSLTPLETVRRLHELAVHDRVLVAWVPGVDDPPLRMWHRTTRTVRATTPEGLNMTWLPWRMKRDYVEKVSKLMLDRRIPRGVPDWIRSESFIEQYLAHAGLYNRRPRPDIGFHYRCAWHINRGDERFTFVPAERKYYFSVGFIGIIAASLTLPPLTKRTGREGTMSETVGWFGDNGCEYTAMADQESTAVLLSEVSRFSIDPNTGTIQASSAAELVEETARRLLTGTKEWPLLGMFLPIPKYEFELLTDHEQE